MRHRVPREDTPAEEASRRLAAMLISRRRELLQRMLFYAAGLVPMAAFFPPYEVMFWGSAILLPEVVEAMLSRHALNRRRAILHVAEGPRLRLLVLFSLLYAMPVVIGVSALWVKGSPQFNFLAGAMLATAGYYASGHTRQLRTGRLIRQGLYVATGLALCAHDLVIYRDALTLAALTQPIGVLTFGTAMLILSETLESASEAQARSLRMERRIRDHAEAASREKSRFLAVMSHEIRTPLNGLLGMAQLLRLSRLEPDQTEKVDMLIESGSALVGILNESLDYSGATTGRLTVTPQPVHLAALCQSVIAPFAAVAEARGLTLAFEAAPDMPRQFLADPQRLRQCLGNLVSNAVKFTDKGGIAVRLSAEPEGQDWLVRIAVQDSGVGVPPEAQEAIFEPYTQAGHGRTRLAGGTGLGLSIARLIARAMGGDVTHAPAAGGGAVFTLNFRAGNGQAKR